jgi:hypothetical protein
MSLGVRYTKKETIILGAALSFWLTLGRLCFFLMLFIGWSYVHIYVTPLSYVARSNSKTTFVCGKITRFLHLNDKGYFYFILLFFLTI